MRSEVVFSVGVFLWVEVVCQRLPALTKCSPAGLLSGELLWGEAWKKQRLFQILRELLLALMNGSCPFVEFGAYSQTTIS